MSQILEKIDLDAYLAASEVVNSDSETIQAIAHHFSQLTPVPCDRAKAVYEFVRDQIPHSFDIQGKVVTCNASDVLKHREGICFAKSHLLAAILRSLGIATGFCYQRLVFSDEDRTRFSLHGLNAIYLEDLQRWVRIDARGNKPGVQAEFCLEQEKLAFPVRSELNEVDDFTIYAQPKNSVVAALRNSKTLAELMHQLPDAL
ncbi:MAG: transglutaminase family protein [Scytolyngbya sp. HA4215-MV1]|jgi:transglutaminase-like putative cysteine protease|nr:transglutaminase family protein [Scytolyngbya sp. HA4215-MV1]